MESIVLYALKVIVSCLQFTKINLSCYENVACCFVWMPVCVAFVCSNTGLGN